MTLTDFRRVAKTQIRASLPKLNTICSKTKIIVYLSDKSSIDTLEVEIKLQLQTSNTTNYEKYFSYSSLFFADKQYFTCSKSR